ncbi:MAG TPA: class I SAM-dependent methyltransferase [Candidatus Elarobacter sp.]|jgi:SAM-dependent methyltransferase
MTPDERDRLRALYDERLARYGHAPETLGWSKPKHKLRYEILLSYWGLEHAPGTSLLDVGCGFGDLYPFARSRGWTIDYHGIDLNPKLIAIAREAYPDAAFAVGDPLVDGIAATYDVIVASGTHNHAAAGRDGYVEATFALFAAHARRGFAVNFLSDRATFTRPENAYADPARVLAAALRHSRRVQLRHDYMPFEFTVIVDLADGFEDELTVFAGYEAFVGT